MRHMAVVEQVNTREGAVPVPRDAEPRGDLGKLAALHAEARETAILANLLGRAPYAMVALAVAAGLSAALSAASMPAAQIMTWLVLMIAGLAAMARAYAHAIAAPFERATLKSFSQDLTAITVYLGFAWGAGAFLILPKVIPFPAVSYAAITAAGFAFLLRDRNIALAFLGPAAALSALACIVRPLPGASLAGLLVLAASAAVAGAILLAARMAQSRAQPA